MVERLPRSSQPMTIFLGCGFAAKYREGGGNFSVPLQWMLGLRRLKLDAIWLELLPATNDSRADQARIDNFQRRLREHGLGGRYCLLYQKPASDAHDLGGMRCFGMSRRALLDRLAGSNALLNLSYSIHPPFLLQFERRIFCDLDPSEIFYWMTKLEMGQSFHDEFWTIGLNVYGGDCQLPKSPLSWKTFYPLADTQLLRRRPRPTAPKFTTIGQWYWTGAVEVNGTFPDLSKKFAFEPYLDLPKQIPEACFELAMNINADDPERARLTRRGWHIVDPHRVARTPGFYRRYIASALWKCSIQRKTCEKSWQFRAAARAKISLAIHHCKTLSGCYSFPVMADLMKADELKTRLKKIPEWELEKKHIERTFEFDDFADAIDFVNAVAEVAEDEEHHPDIDIRYNKVHLVLSTHSKGGLTELDFGLAERIDTLAE